MKSVYRYFMNFLSGVIDVLVLRVYVCSMTLGSSLESLTIKTRRTPTDLAYLRYSLWEKIPWNAELSKPSFGA